MKKTIIAAALLAASATSAQADTIGLYVGGQVWDNEASGLFGEAVSQINFNLEDQQQGSYFVAVEHPLPLIPNARVSFTTLETNGMTTLTSDFEFADQTFTAGTEVNADFDVSYADYTLYYELFDNDLISFDFGLTLRDFDGDVAVSSSGVTGKLETDEYVPMLYVATNFGIPATPLNVFAQGNLLSIDDHTLYEYQVGVSYELIENLAVDVNLTLGYREVKLELEDINDLYTNIDFSGVYAGAVVHF